MASASARREDHFQKRTFPSDFVKLGPEIPYLFLSGKLSFICLFVVVVLLQLCPILVCFLIDY